MADAAINAELVALEGRKLDINNDLEIAEENLKEAMYPSEIIKDRSRYIDTLYNNRNEVEAIKESIEENNAKMQFLQDTKGEY